MKTFRELDGFLCGGWAQKTDWSRLLKNQVLIIPSGNSDLQRSKIIEMLENRGSRNDFLFNEKYIFLGFMNYYDLMRIIPSIFPQKIACIA